LRSVKTALRTVTAGLHWQMPQNLMDESVRTEPFEERVGFPVDAVLVGAWAAAMSALEIDADAELPNQF
jgi:hypothetical protein